MSKKPIQSRTLWFNVLSIVAVIVTEVLSNTELKELLGGYTGTIMILGAVINAMLRLDTSKAISSEPASENNTHPQSTDNIIIDELQKDDNNMGMF